MQVEVLNDSLQPAGPNFDTLTVVQILPPVEAAEFLNYSTDYLDDLGKARRLRTGIETHGRILTQPLFVPISLWGGGRALGHF